MNKQILTLCSFLLMIAQYVSAKSDSAIRAYEIGIKAYDNKNYIAALPALKQAASAGIAESYEPLINLYADGDYNGSGRGEYTEALVWTVLAIQQYFEEGANNSNLAIIGFMYYDPLCFFTGDYQEVVDHGTKTMATSATPYLLNQIAASYIKLGDTSNAIEWLKKAKTLAKKQDDRLSVHTANAILSKIYLNKKDYGKALKLS